jgi:4-amino-4-deoxy-L-arabinose transferase-like glycosyltransferase
MPALSATLRAAEPASGCLEHLKNPASLDVSFRISCLAWVTVLGSALFFCYRLHERDLWSSHEARAAQNACSVLCGQWLLPQLFDGRLELQKPPLYYWLIASWCWLSQRDVDALAVRLPAALAASCIVLTLIVCGYILGRLRASLLAVGALLLMPHFVWLARVGRVDMPLAASLTVALTAMLVRHRLAHPYLRHGCFLLMLLALAAGLLCKGPIAIVLFSAVMISNCVCDRLISRQSWSIHDLALSFRAQAANILASVIVFGPVLLWYIAANAATEGDWVREFLYRHNLARGLGGDSRLDRHQHWSGPAFYLVRLVFDAGPVALLALWLACRDYRRIGEDRAVRFSAIWFLVMLLFFSCMRYKRADYLLPAYPALAMFVGFRLDEFLNSLTTSQRKRWYLGYTSAVAISVVGWCIYITWVLPEINQVRQERDFAQVVRQYCGADQAIYMFGTEAHLLSYHVGPPIRRSFDAEQVRGWLEGRGPLYVIVSRKALRQLEGSGLGWEVVVSDERPALSGWWRWLSGDEEEKLLLVRIYREPGELVGRS